MTPRISVIMPVYNGVDFLAEAIDSILGQTYRDLELIVVDDASTDATASALDRYDDPRLVRLRNDENRNQAWSANRALEVAQGELVARMDADDIARPERFDEQVRFLDANPDIGVVGSWIRTFGAVDGAVWRLPTTHDEIQVRTLFRAVLAQPTVLFRRRALDDAGLRYEPSRAPAEDLDLWRRSTFAFRHANLPKVLLDYRIKTPEVRGAIPASIVPMDRRSELLRAIFADSLDALGLAHHDADLETHRIIGSHEFSAEPAELDRVEDWLLRLLEANGRSRRYPEPAFTRLVGEQWFFTCYGHADTPTLALRRLVRSPLRRHVQVRADRWAKLAARLARRRGLGPRPTA